MIQIMSSKFNAQFPQFNITKYRKCIDFFLFLNCNFMCLALPESYFRHSWRFCFENLATNLPQLLSLGRSVRAEVSQLCCLNSEYSAQVLTLFAIFKFIRTLPSIYENKFYRLNSEYPTRFPTLQSLIQRPFKDMSLWYIEFCD